MFKFTVFGYGQGLLEGLCAPDHIFEAVRFVAINLDINLSMDDFVPEVGKLHAHVPNRIQSDKDGIHILFEDVEPLQDDPEFVDHNDDINPNWIHGRSIIQLGFPVIVWGPMFTSAVDPMRSNNGWVKL